MPRSTLRFSAALSACAAMLALSSCSSSSEPAEQTSSPSAAAAGEQKVVVYSGRNEELVGPLLEQFTSDTGIDVEVRYAGSGELAAQLITEGQNSPADVFLSQDAGALGAVSQAGLFAPIDAETLSAVPAEYSAADGTWVGVSGRARTIVYNPELVATPPDTIDGLLDPQWRGQIAYAPSNASWQSFVTGLRVLRGDEGAQEWLQAFKAQDPQPYESNGQIRDAVDAGEIGMGLINHYYMYELINSKGADNVAARLQFMAPGDPGGLVNVAGVGVLATAPDPEAAQAFAAYLVGESAQEYFASETAEFPLLDGVAVVGDVPALTDLDPPAVDLSQLDDIEATQQMLVDTGLLTN
jgi:iron(III) transport system substrate-binding protein